jgi:hypothetical protein
MAGWLIFALCGSAWTGAAIALGMLIGRITTARDKQVPIDAGLDVLFDEYGTRHALFIADLDDDSEAEICQECGQDWPCDTIAALEA